MPTYEALDTTLFARIYVTMEECHRRVPQRPPLTRPQKQALWAPILAEIRQMMGLNVSSSQPELAPEPGPGPVIDVDMEEDTPGSDEDTPGSDEGTPDSSQGSGGDGEMEL